MRKNSIPSNFSVEKARNFQRLLASKIIKYDTIKISDIKYVGGVDVSYKGNKAIGAWVVLDFKTLKLIDKAIAITEVKFPYIPTLLAFREVPPAVAAYKKLKVKPDVTLVDGQGLLHPYRAGFASHLGFVLNIVTIGVAKKLLCGKVGEWNNDVAYVFDNNEVIGVALKTRGKPIYVSIGHKISLQTSIEIVKRCITRYRLPEPIRLAHITAKQVNLLDEYFS